MLRPIVLVVGLTALPLAVLAHFKLLEPAEWVKTSDLEPVSKVETSLPENVLILRLVYGDGDAEEQGAAGALVVRN